MALWKDSKKTGDEKNPCLKAEMSEVRQALGRGGARLPRQPPAGFEWMERYLKPQDTKPHTVLQTQVQAES